MTNSDARTGYKSFRLNDNMKNQVYAQKHMFNSLFLVNADCLIQQPEDQCLLRCSDVAVLAQVILAMSQGRLETAIFFLENHLIQNTGYESDQFQSALILWNALCYLYLLDKDAALHWTSVLLSNPKQFLIPEATLLNAFIFRISGRVCESVELFASLSRKNSGLCYDARRTALTWYFESALVLGKLNPTQRQLLWIRSHSMHKYWCNGIYSVVEYRLLCMLNSGVTRRKQILRELHHSPILQHPLLTLLLSELLSKPLKGVEQGERTLWYYQ